MDKKLDINLNNFEGPIDLLLSLVRDKKMDIFDVDLVELANEYLKVIDNIKNKDFDLAAEYLVMASTLINIKAKALMKNPDEAEELDATKEDLLKKLVAHQQFKNIAADLRKKEKLRNDIYIKEQNDVSSFKKEIDESKLDGNMDPIKMITSLRKMFERTNAKTLRETTIEKFNLSPAERRIELIKLFKEKDQILFEDIFNVASINHFVVTILTILDMSRKQELIISQDNQFDMITFKKGVINEL